MKTFLSWFLIGMLFSLVIWGYILNEAHQKRFSDADVQRKLNDTVVIRTPARDSAERREGR